MTIANAEAAGAAVTAREAPVMGLGAVAAGRFVAGMGYVSAGIIAGQAISGIAHGGIDEIPEESTWLLQKGERVLSPNQNIEVQKAAEKINATPVTYAQSLPNTAPNYSSVSTSKAANDSSIAKGVVVNIHEDASKAGQSEQTRGLSAEDVIDIYVSNIKAGGAAADMNEHTYKLERSGR
jgi:hypothetical protein